MASLLSAGTTNSVVEAVLSLATDMLTSLSSLSETTFDLSSGISGVSYLALILSLNDVGIEGGSSDGTGGHSDEGGSDDGKKGDGTGEGNAAWGSDGGKDGGAFDEGRGGGASDEGKKGGASDAGRGGVSDEGKMKDGGASDAGSGGGASDEGKGGGASDKATVGGGAE